MKNKKPNMQSFQKTPSITAKALRMNLDERIYGTFAEIGAGQETVRHFFRVGGASGTIAKAMSAYDKNFSNSVYGRDKENRYVTEERLLKMLDYEIDLIEKRLPRELYPNKLFFTYSNTVATIDFAKKFKGHGWIGIHFQLEPEMPYNKIILHVRFKQNETRLQQETLGILGVNLIYGAFYKHNKPIKLLRYLYDHIDKDILEIDMINFSGPDFENIDNRLISLELIKNGMTQAVMFNSEKKNILAASQLYKKHILALRGSFRPVTKVNISMLEKSLDLFLKEKGVDKDKTEVIFEITLSNLRTYGDVNDQDFIDRADILCSLGQTVMISDFKEYYRLVEYFNEYTKEKIALTMGVNNLIDIFNEKFYTDLSGGILEAFGRLFNKDMRIYLYPMWNIKTQKIDNSDTLKVDPRLKELYKFFKKNKKIVDISEYKKEEFNINSREALRMIGSRIPGWEKLLPKGVSEMIIKKKLFGFQEDAEKESNNFLFTSNY